MKFKESENYLNSRECEYSFNVLGFQDQEKKYIFQSLSINAQTERQSKYSTLQSNRSCRKSFTKFYSCVLESIKRVYLKRYWEGDGYILSSAAESQKQLGL